jgi:hypothetical protein
MINNKYLNENNYQKLEKGLKIWAIIFILLGIVVLGLGIYQIIKANNMNIPQMSDSNWFEASEKQNQIKFLGIVLCMFGVFITFGIGGTILTIAYRRKIMAFQVEQTMPIAKEGIMDIAPTIGAASSIALKEVSPAYGQVAKEITKGIKEELNDDLVDCPKCHNKNNKNNKYCSSCGYKLK